MSDHGREGALAEGARWSTGAQARGAGEGGRFSSRRKTEAALRLLRGEGLEVLSRELGVTAATLSGWREAFLAAGTGALKSRPADARDGEVARLQAKVGEITMANELLEEKIERLEAGRPLGGRRPRGWAGPPPPPRARPMVWTASAACGACPARRCTTSASAPWRPKSRAGGAPWDPAPMRSLWDTSGRCLRPPPSTGRATARCGRG